MVNNGFSYSSRLASSTISAINTGEPQPEQNVEQEQQAIFSGRSSVPYDSENPFLEALYASRAANPVTSASSTITSLTITTSAVQHPLVTDVPAISGSAIVNVPVDPFAALASYRPIRSEEERPQLFSGFGIFDDFNEPFPKKPEAALINSQPSGQTTPAPVMDSPIQQVSRQDNNPPANLSASYQGYASAPDPNVMVDSGIPLNLIQSIVTEPFHPHLLQSLTPKSPVVSPPVQIVAKIKPSRRKQCPADKWLFRCNLIDTPFICGYPGCGKTFRSCCYLRKHIFDHTHVSDYRCTYRECGPNRYFRDSKQLKTHIRREHTLKQKGYACTICHQLYESTEILQLHVRNEHSIPPH